jgi:hypothetical protein
VFGLRQAHGGLAGFPFAALLEEFDALEALEDGTFAADGGAGLEAVVLGHLGMRLKIVGGGSYGWLFPVAIRKRGNFSREDVDA